MDRKILKYFSASFIIFVSVFMLKLNSALACGPELVSVTYSKENVLEIDVKDIKDNVTINNNIIYVANRNSRMVNGQKLPSGGLTVVSPLNVYIKGDYNIDAQWAPSAIITNSLVYVLSDLFEDRQEMPALRLPRNYPYVLDPIKTDNLLGVSLVNLLTSGNAADKAALEAEIRSYFGLSSFSVSGVTSESGLENAIGNKYYSEYNNTSAGGTNRTPDRAQNTVVKVAIASPYDVSNPWGSTDAYMLEDWSGRSINIEGAFIQLKDSWIADTNDIDGDGDTTEPMRDVPPPGYYKRTGGPNAQGGDSMWSGMSSMSQFIYATNPLFEYEEQFANAGTRPSGDFLAGSQSRWEELDATGDNFTHHKL